MCSYHTFPLMTFPLYRTLARDKCYLGGLPYASNASTSLACISISTAAPLQLTVTLKSAHHLTHLFHLSFISSAL